MGAALPSILRDQVTPNVVRRRAAEETVMQVAAVIPARARMISAISKLPETMLVPETVTHQGTEHILSTSWQGRISVERTRNFRVQLFRRRDYEFDGIRVV
eukprot:4741445-Pyramimonas_sp.AAC.1